MFYGLGGVDSASCHVQCGSATPVPSTGHLLPSFESMPPPPYVARDPLASYPVMSPGATSFVQPNTVPASNMPAINAYYVHQQQQQQQHLSMSPFSASSHGNAGEHLVSELTPSALSASPAYPDIRSVCNGYWSPPSNDSRFSSKLLAQVAHLFVR